MSDATSGRDVIEEIRNTTIYLALGLATLAVSWLSFYAVRPWILESSQSHNAIAAVWLLTTIAVIYVIGQRY